MAFRISFFAAAMSTTCRQFSLSANMSPSGKSVITIVDYGTSNLGSMQNMLKKIGATSTIASSPNDLEGASKIIVPGVGSFDAGMGKLRNSGMIPTLNHKALIEKVPMLGVCLGMQLM